MVGVKNVYPAVSQGEYKENKKSSNNKAGSSNMHKKTEGVPVLLRGVGFWI